MRSLLACHPDWGCRQQAGQELLTLGLSPFSMMVCDMKEPLRRTSHLP